MKYNQNIQPKSDTKTLVKNVQRLFYRIGPSHDQAFVRIQVRSGERKTESKKKRVKESLVKHKKSIH
jgi:hypothetical protein